MPSLEPHRPIRRGFGVDGVAFAARGLTGNYSWPIYVISIYKTMADECHGRTRDRECTCVVDRVPRLLEPAILLALRQRPGHGYELLPQVEELGLADGPVDPGGLYRCLRQMEAEGAVESEWDTSGDGPARRRYRLTGAGEELLAAWAQVIERKAKAMREFVRSYREDKAKRVESVSERR